MEVVNLAAAFARIADHWQPRLAGEINDCAVKLAKLRGEFVWHHHEAEDDVITSYSIHYTKLYDRLPS